MSVHPEAPVLTLRDLRRTRGWTLDAVGVLSNLDPATVSRIERGLVEAKPETIVRLARGFAISARRMRQIIEATAAASVQGHPS